MLAEVLIMLAEVLDRITKCWHMKHQKIRVFKKDLLTVSFKCMSLWVQTTHTKKKPKKSKLRYCEKMALCSWPTATCMYMGICSWITVTSIEEKKNKSHDSSYTFSFETLICGQFVTMISTLTLVQALIDISCTHDMPQVHGQHMIS